MNNNYAVIDSTGLVKRIISWDGAQPYVPENGCAVILSGGAGSDWTYNADGTFTAPPESVTPPLTAKQRAAEAMAAGLIVKSASTPELNGTYGLDANSQQNVIGTVTAILLTGNFPNGQGAMPWIDATGAPHIWPSTTEFKIFAAAFSAFVSNVALYAASNGAAGAIPSNEVTIP